MSLFWLRLLAGVILAILAAIFTAFAFFAIGSIPKSESALVIALWFHGAAAISAVFPLMASYFSIAKALNKLSSDQDL